MNDFNIFTTLALLGVIHINTEEPIDSHTFSCEGVRPGIISFMKKGSRGVILIPTKKGKVRKVSKKHKNEKGKGYDFNEYWDIKSAVKIISKRKNNRSIIKTLSSFDPTYKEIFVTNSSDYSNDSLVTKRDKNGFLEFASFSS